MRANNHHLTFILATLLCVLTSCYHTWDNVYFNIDYPEIKEQAKTRKQPFCIVLTDSTYNSKLYFQKIKQTQDKAIWNFINTELPQNHWYQHLIGSQKRPFTLVFNKEGKLVNIVYGVSHYAIQSVESSITTPQNISYLFFGFASNSTLTINKDIAKELNAAITLREYTSKEPNKLKLRMSQSTYYCLSQDTILIHIEAINDSPRDIQISSIEPSCSCILIPKDFQRNISPWQHTDYTFKISTQEKGRIYREISFLSNADLPESWIGFNIIVQ